MFCQCFLWWCFSCDAYYKRINNVLLLLMLARCAHVRMLKPLPKIKIHNCRWNDTWTCWTCDKQTFKHYYISRKYAFAYGSLKQKPTKVSLNLLLRKIYYWKKNQQLILPQPTQSPYPLCWVSLCMQKWGGKHFFILIFLRHFVHWRRNSMHLRLWNVILCIIPNILKLKQ